MSSLFSKWWTRKSHNRKAKPMVRPRPIWPSRAHLLLEQLEGRVVPTGNINVTALPGPIAAASGNTLTDQPVATFTYSSGPSDPSYYSATINWGDSLSSAGTIVYADPTDQANGVFTVEGSHTYALPGSYAVTVNVIEGPVHRYSFTTDASDSIGGANGTLMGDANISNGAVNLDGSTGTYVNLPAYILPTTGSVTLEAWGSYQATGSWARIFDFGNIDGNSAGSNYLFLSPIPGGTNAAGTAAIGNGYDGIAVDTNVSGVTIGGTTAAARNIISGSGYNAGVEFYQSGPGNLVLGNYIGLDITGTQALGNAGWGVVIGGRHGRGAQIDLALAVSRRVGRGAGVEIERERAIGRAVERTANTGCGAGDGAHEHREILQVVGAGIGVARIVSRDAILAQIDAERAVTEDGVAATRFTAW